MSPQAVRPLRPVHCLPARRGRAKREDASMNPAGAPAC